MSGPVGAPLDGPLILLHGFTQTTASFDPLRAALTGRGIDTVVPPLAGHDTGQGPEHLVTGDLWSGAEDLVAAGHRGVWFGYSMGARLACHVALAHPEAVNGLILLGGTAGIAEDDERVARRRHDEALAERIITIGLDAFLDEWLALELFATLPDDPDRKARRSTNHAAGLASSLVRWGTGTMDPPLWDSLGQIKAPTLVIAGSLDAKFTDLGRKMATAIGPNARFEPVPDAGHAAHLERPVPVAALVDDFVSGRSSPTIPRPI